MQFPGANSISFMEKHMYFLQARKTVVCEKSDGVRFFLCEVFFRDKNGQWFGKWSRNRLRASVRGARVRDPVLRPVLRVVGPPPTATTHTHRSEEVGRNMK